MLVCNKSRVSPGGATPQVQERQQQHKNRTVEPAEILKISLDNAYLGWLAYNCGAYLLRKI